jgi:hypothetical protein
MMLILFVVLVVGVFMIYAAGSGNRGSGSSDMRPLILPPPLLFPVAMLHLSLGAFLGAFLKQQMATHRAALVPGYRTPHLIAAALVVLFPMAVVTVTAVGRLGALARHHRVVGVCSHDRTLWRKRLAAGLSGRCFAFLMATLLVSHIRAAVFEMLNGQQPGMAWSLISDSPGRRRSVVSPSGHAGRR